MKPEILSDIETKDYSRKWHAMAAVGTGVFLGTVDGSIINVSLPTLVRELHTEFAVVQWVVLAYLLIVTSTMAGIGRLADMVGKKTIYMTGFIIFTLGSALCGLSPSVNWLIGFRVLQAIGAAMTMALGAAILTEAFPPSERGKAMGMIGTVVSMGIVLGPALGGMILGLLSWHWIFFVNLPVGIIGTLMAQRNLPNFKPGTRQRFDIPGALSLFLSILFLLLGLTLGQQQGFFQPLIGLLLGLSLIFLVIFIIIENKTAEPMIDPGLFDNPVFNVNLTTGVICFVGLGGTIILLPFYLENILKFPSMKVGLLMGIVPVMLGITSPLAGALSDRAGSRKITMTGLFLLLFGFLAAATLDQHTTVWGYALRIFMVGAGLGIFMSPNNSAIMGTAPRHRLGIVSSMMAQSRTLGQTVGVAVIGAVWAGRTLFYTGTGVSGGATLAPAKAQIAGLHDAFLTAAGLTVIALLLIIRAYIHETRQSGK
ncbi:MAG: MFS transporter [Desulfobacula sp.]|jgi:EmrB/QacA subfamily drug resistance transporter